MTTDYDPVANGIGCYNDWIEYRRAKLLRERRERRTTYILAGCVAIAAIVLSTSPLWAHDWYTGSENPVTKRSCCGTDDCVPIPPGDVKYGNGAITFRYPLDGQEYTIPLNQTLPSVDGQNHGCVWGKKALNGPYLCFFVGGGT